MKIMFKGSIVCFWLINTNSTEVKRFSRNNKSQDRFREYVFIDTGKIIGIFGDKHPLMKIRVSVKKYETREIYKRLISQRQSKTKPVWL